MFCPHYTKDFSTSNFPNHHTQNIVFCAYLPMIPNQAATSRIPAIQLGNVVQCFTHTHTHTHTHTSSPSSSQLRHTFCVLAPLFKIMAPTSHTCWHTYTLDCQGWCQYRSLYNGQGTDSNSVEKSTSWEACNSSASWDVPHILWNHIHKNLLLVHILCKSIKNRKSRGIESAML